MKTLLVCLMGLMIFVQAGTAQQSTVSGQVWLSGGQPVAGAQVMLFDLADLLRGPVARATTDESGHFALPLASLGGSALPQGFALEQNYPNPFNPSTVIPYQLPTAVPVRLEVFNLLGQRIATLVDEERPAGFHTAQWDATDAVGQAVAAGVYIYRLMAGGEWHTRRMVLIDGQAGVAAGVPVPAAAVVPAAAQQKYGIAVVGAGVAPYIEADFRVRVGMAPVEFVVETVEGLPQGKATDGIFGDVNNDGQVDTNDALIVAMYSRDSSMTTPNNGDMSLGDVNSDGQVNLGDAVAILGYVANPLDASLPVGIGQRIASGKRASDGSGVRQLVNLTNNSDSRDETPTWSPDGSHIAFSSNRDGNFDIYVMKVNGGSLTNLTDHGNEDKQPAWSPDGRYIAFSSNRDGDPDVFDIYVMAADGSDVRPLTNHRRRNWSPTWSPDGRYIAFSSNRDGDPDVFDIYVMAADGSDVRPLTNHRRRNWSPTWSPDGRYIAFSSNRDGDLAIYVMAADGSGVRHLTDGGQPAWSPDGRHLAFSSNRDGDLAIYVMAADGSDVSRLTYHENSHNQTPIWSPDGRRIAFSSNRDGEFDIYMMAVNGSGGGEGQPVARDTTFDQPTRSERVVIAGLEVEAAENEILVFLDEDVSSAEIRDAQAEILNQGGSVKSLNFDLRTIQVGITDDIVEQDFINVLSRQSGISGANVNEVVTPESFITSNDEGYRQWRTRFPTPPLAKVPAPTSVSFSGDYWIDQIDATRAWAALSDPSVTLAPNAIGIVDTGVPASQDILNNSRISRYTEKGDSMSDDDTWDHPEGGPHGFNVTGYAAGYSNKPDRRGVNPHSDVVFVDVFRADGSRTFVTDLLQGIKTAIDQGAGVVNISWGPLLDCKDVASTRQMAKQQFRMAHNGAVHYARKRNVLLVWSAGNDCEKQDDRLLPLDKKTGAVDVASTDSWLSHTLIVGASSESLSDACFSQMGEVVNIMAPGEKVAFYADATGDGTSYAAPMVTGAAGLIRAIESTISAEETRSILINSARNTITFNRACGEPVASSPAGLLNLGSAIQSSLVAHGVGIETKGEVRLSKGQTYSVPIDVTVPAGGAYAIDVGFVIDQSGSYEDDIETLQTRAQDIVNSLRSRADIDVQFGVAGFADFPQGDYGDTGDVPYRLYQDITGDSDALIAAIDKLNKPLMHGDDAPESQYEALFRAAREIGWRDGTLRILLLATDADFHNSDTDPSYPGTGRRAALETLAAENVIVIGLQSGDRAAARLRELAEATDGSVLSLDAASSQIVEAIVRGLDAALADVDVTLDVLAGQSWVTGVYPTVHKGVSGGQTVRFTVSLVGQRDPSVEDLPYNVYIWARGDGAALLSRTKIPILVSKESAE